MPKTEIRGAQILDATVDLTADVTGILPAANGGSGVSSPTANYALLGNGAGAFQTVAPGASGNVLRSNGTTWASAVASKRVVAMTDGATITPNADTTDIGTVTLGGNRTMAAPSGTPTDGQQLILRLRQDGTGSRTITWNAIYRFGTDVDSPTLTTTINKSDYIGFMYNSTDTKWDALAVTREL